MPIEFKMTVDCYESILEELGEAFSSFHYGTTPFRYAMLVIMEGPGC